MKGRQNISPIHPYGEKYGMRKNSLKQDSQSCKNVLKQIMSGKATHPAKNE